MKNGLDKERKKALQELQKKIGYRFKSLELLNQGLKHKSYVHENVDAEGQDNERLEFLGDAVLDLVIAHMIMDRYPDYPEGSLSRLRAAVVNETRLAKIARDLSLGKYLLLGKGEDLTRGREKSSILSSSLEALLASIYLDAGFKKAFRVISRLFALPLEVAEKESFYQDYKTKLQELSQEALRATPRYVLAKQCGPAHARVFGVKVQIQGKTAGAGAGRSKKEAEQRAAMRTIQILYQSLKEKNG